jgi:hypothetical protein
MPLTLKQIEHKCLFNKGSDQCRFLAEDEKGQYYCIKKTPQRADIDKEVVDYIKRQNAQGVNPRKQRFPIGDNCPGYTFFRYKMQGYDIDP